MKTSPQKQAAKFLPFSLQIQAGRGCSSEGRAEQAAVSTSLSPAQPGMGASPGLAQAVAHWNTGTQSVAKRKDFPMEPSGRRGNSRKMSPMQTFPFSYVLILHATEAEIKLWDINTRTDP